MKLSRNWIFLVVFTAFSAVLILSKNKLGGTFSLIESLTSRPDIFWAKVSQTFLPPENVPLSNDSNNEPEFVLKLDSLPEDFLENPKEIEVKEVETGEENQAPVFSLADIQEQLDDIAEKIDILTTEVSLLVNANNSLVEEKTKEDEEEKEDKIEEEEKKKEETEELKKAITKTVEVQFCEKKPGSMPSKNKIIFNEIAWMGTQNSSNDEWIELKNISGQDIDLTGWQIIDKESQIKIGLKGKIPSSGFYLLERTSDETLPEISTDFIYNGALNDTSEALYIFNGSCRLEDEILALPDWPAGDKQEKRTMERKDDFAWQTSAEIGGTPKKANSQGYLVFSGGGGISLPSTPSFPKILISEIQISGLDSEDKIREKDDFVELFNPNNEEIDLTDWYLQRKTKGAAEFSSYAPKDLFSGQTIKPHSYFLIVNASSSNIDIADTTTTYPLTENNTLVLKNPNREIVDMVGWGEAPDFETAPAPNPGAGQSIGRKWDEAKENYIDTDNNQLDFAIKEPTPLLKNQNLEPENQLPLAKFVYSPENPVIGQEILFDASSSTDPDGSILSYFWDFGGSHSTTTNRAATSHSFASSGEFIITLATIDNLFASSSFATTAIKISPLLQTILELSIATLNFKAEQGEIVKQNLIIKNSGEGELNWSSSINYFTSSTNWLLISPATGTIPIFGSSIIEILANSLDLGVGNYQATATIESVLAQNSPQQLAVDLSVFTKTLKTVIINEIAWMGNNATNPTDEWIELYNNTSVPMDITGWTLSTADSIPNIIFPTSTIPANGYFLLERTNDDTVSDIPADLIYTGALGNNGEKLALRDKEGSLIDLVDCSLGWFAGDSGDNYLSMERVNPSLAGSDSENWKSNNGIIKNGLDVEGNTIFGTPKAKNSVSL